MKKVTLLCFFTIYSLVKALAQFPEDFNLKCATGGITPGGWVVYNPDATSSGNRWACSPAGGRPAPTGGSATPGMVCTGVSGSAFMLDTSYLITPYLHFDPSAYPGGHVYLRFDSKRETIVTSGRLSVFWSMDTTILLSSSLDTLVSPVITTDDTTGWVTHQVDLSSYIGPTWFYVAFRYTSTVSQGTAWHIDNISVSTVPLNVYDTHAAKHGLALSVVGGNTPSQITIGYTVPAAGAYQLRVYDMMGRSVYTGALEARTQTATYTINDLHLDPGMYCVKMGNADAYGTTKLMIQ